MNKTFISILVIVFILFIGFALLGPKPINDEYLNAQQSTEKKLREEYKEKNRTMDNPYIKVNPYNTNELSAYVAFDSDTPVSYTYTVEGKTKETSYTYSNDEFQTDPIISVVGLYENYDNTVKMTFKEEDGTTTDETYTIKTGEPDIKLEKADIDIKDETTYKELMDDSAIIDNYSYVYDEEGELRASGFVQDSWYGYTQEYNGHYLIPQRDENGKYTSMYQVNTMGRANPDFVLNAPDGYYFHHDAIEENDKIYALVSPIDDNYTAEQNRESDIAIYSEDGTQQDLINLSDLNEDSDTVIANSDPYDFHMNSIDYYEKDNELILNSRTYSRIYAYNLDTGNIDWIIDDPDTVSKKDQDLALTPEGDIDYPNGEHTVKVANENLKDEPYYNDDMLYLSIYNNRTCVNDGKEVTKDYSDEAGTCGKENAQGLIYEVDVKNKTFKQVDKIDTEYESSTTGNFYVNDGYREIYDSNAGHYLLYDENDQLVADFFLPIISENGDTEDEPFTYRCRKISVDDLSNHVEKF